MSETHRSDTELGPAPEPYRPRTDLGRALMEIHQRILASGQPLLTDWDDLGREIADRRAGVIDDTDRRGDPPTP